MDSLKKRYGGKLPLIGDMLFSVLTIPFCYSCLEIGLKSPQSPDYILWLFLAYATMGVANLFRAFRLRDRSESAFRAHLVYGLVLVASAVAVRIIGITDGMMVALGLVFWGWLLADRVRVMLYRRTRWNVVLNALAALLMLMMLFTAFLPVSIQVVMGVAYLWGLISVMGIAFSRIRLDVLREIVRETYAMEIIFGLLLLIVAFSYVLKYLDPAFNTFEEGLWYCFAVVTTIGFGDVTPVTTTGRVLSVILGLYGIIVVALITSIIVNFYSEMKTEKATRKAEDDDLPERSHCP